MSELERSESAGGGLAAAGGVLETVVAYAIVIGQLTAAGIRMAWLGDQVRSTYRYVEGCARSVDHLAEQMSGLTVDRDTVAEHHQAAAVMRGVLADAEALAATTEDMAVLFAQASAAHQGDYGPVSESIAAMPVPMADASFYANR